MIAVAKQEGNTVRVYDEQNRFLFARTGELQGGGGVYGIDRRHQGREPGRRL